MISIDGGFKILRFNKRKYNKTLDEKLGSLLRQAARIWLRAVLTSVPARGGFPVLTGEAKSTLVPLGRFLRVAVPVRPVEGDKRSKGESSQSFKIIDDTRSGRKFIYRFEWSNSVLHYYINEYFGLIPFAPWNTTEAGAAAFTSYLEQELLRQVPNLLDHIESEEPI